MNHLSDEDVREILRLLDGSSFDEMQLETQRFKLTLRRGASGGWTQERRTTAAVSAAPTAFPAPSRNAPQAQSKSDGVVEVVPPIMGTFYRAPKPGALPFVDVGTPVEKETVVGIVETMKLMNSVYAGTQGVVVEICAVDGQLVEQGHVLMRIRP
jgi:acetyl-CoA carboxylase biotin carboxyl carrier protein